MKNLFFITILCSLFIFTSCEKDFPIKVEGGFQNTYIPYNPSVEKQTISLDISSQGDVFLEFIYKNTNTNKISLTNNHSTHMNIDYDQSYDEDDYNRDYSSYSSSSQLWRDSKGRIRPKKGVKLTEIVINTKSYNESYGIRVTIDIFGNRTSEDIFYDNYEYTPYYDNFYFNFSNSDKVYRLFYPSDKTTQNSLVFDQTYYTFFLSYSEKSDALYFRRASGTSSYISKYDIQTKKTSNLRSFNYNILFSKSVENTTEFIVNNSIDKAILFYDEAKGLQHSISSNYTINNASATKVGNDYHTVYFERYISYYRLRKKVGLTTSTLDSYVYNPKDVAISPDGKSIAYVDGNYLYIQHDGGSFRSIPYTYIDQIDFNADGELLILKRGSIYKINAKETTISSLYENHSIYNATW